MILRLDDYFNLYTNAVKKCKNQVKLSQFLREHNFKYVENHILEELETKLNILPKHERWNFMVIECLDGSYDDFLAFGIKLKGKHSEKVHIYFNYHYLETLKVEVGVDHKNWRKPKMYTKFEAVVPRERRKEWSNEHKKVLADPEYRGTKFYRRNKKNVTFITK